MVQYEVVLDTGEIFVIRGDNFGDGIKKAGWSGLLASEIKIVREVDDSGHYKSELPFAM